MDELREFQRRGGQAERKYVFASAAGVGEGEAFDVLRIVEEAIAFCLDQAWVVLAEALQAPSTWCRHV